MTHYTSIHSHRHPWLNKLNAAANAAAFHGFNPKRSCLYSGLVEACCQRFHDYGVIAGDLPGLLGFKT